jgi:hypothetical protein
MGNDELQATATADLSTRFERALAVFAMAIDHSESKFASGADQDHRNRKIGVSSDVQN